MSNSPNRTPSLFFVVGKLKSRPTHGHNANWIEIQEPKKSLFLVSTTADVQKMTSTSATSFDDVQSRHVAGDGMAQIVSGLFLLKVIRII